MIKFKEIKEQKMKRKHKIKTYCTEIYIFKNIKKINNQLSKDVK